METHGCYAAVVQRSSLIVVLMAIGMTVEQIDAFKDYLLVMDSLQGIRDSDRPHPLRPKIVPGQFPGLEALSGKNLLTLLIAF